MATTKKHRNAPFVATDSQQTLLAEFKRLVDNGTLASTRKQSRYLFETVGMTVGEIAVFLDKRFQQVYQATR